jgi:hypothetical protein
MLVLQAGTGSAALHACFMWRAAEFRDVARGNVKM